MPCDRVRDESVRRLATSAADYIFVTDKAMLSPAVLQMLDQVRSEFGVEVEVVDANLTKSWAPEGQRAPRVLAGPELRAIGLDVLRAGRASVVDVDGREYRLVPLRNSRSVSPTALMAMRVRRDLAAGPDRATPSGAGSDGRADVEPPENNPRYDEGQRYDHAEPPAGSSRRLTCRVVG